MFFLTTLLKAASLTKTVKDQHMDR